jgi:hypothetical protein
MTANTTIAGAWCVTMAMGLSRLCGRAWDVLRQNNVLSQFERFRKLFGRATKRDDQLENNCHAMVVFDDVYALALIRRACPIRIRDLRRVALIRTGNVA